jgi:3-phenylpropionate/cinnamic acid dioxygenase small subunit
MQMDSDCVLVTDQQKKEHLVWYFLVDKFEWIEGNLNALEIDFIGSNVVIFYGREWKEEEEEEEEKEGNKGEFYPYFNMNIYSKTNFKTSFSIEDRIFWKKRWGNDFELDEKYTMIVEKEIIIFDAKTLQVEKKKINEDLFYFPSGSNLRMGTGNNFSSLVSFQLKEKVAKKSRKNKVCFVGEILDVDSHYRLLAIKNKDQQSIVVRGLFHPNKEIGSVQIKKKDAIISFRIKEAILLMATSHLIDIFDIQGKHLRSIQLSNYKLSAKSIILDNHYIYAFGNGAIKVSLKTYQEIHWNYLRVCIFGKEGLL